MAYTKILCPDVVVVGAGVIGGPLAIGLKKKGLEVLLVERSAKVRRVFKGEYMQPQPVATLQKLGLGSIFTKPSFDSIHNLRFRDLDKNSNEVISDIMMEYPASHSAKTFTHDTLVNELRAKAHETLGEDFWLGANLVPLNHNERDFLIRPEFELRHPERGTALVRPKWVIGCDGRTSQVRNWMKGPEAPKNRRILLGATPEHIIGAEIATKSPVKGCYQVFRSYGEGTLFAFELPGIGQRLYYSSLDRPGVGKDQWAKSIKKIINDVRPHEKLGELDEEAPILGCPAYQMWFGPSFGGNFLLAGDAVATTTPYAGQGISAGMEHVDYLIDEFDFSTSLAKSTQDSQKAYAEKTRAIQERLDIVNLGLYYLFFARAPLFKTTTRHVTNTWKLAPELPNRVMRLFAGIDKDKPGLAELFDLWGISRKGLTTVLGRPVFQRDTQ
ncbi:MAG: FAD-dependent monooxygenase [Pseudomonadota bacterium]|nr:FAD-dependent monooxygenase [Pseudomonadota bacterium]